MNRHFTTGFCKAGSSIFVWAMSTSWVSKTKTYWIWVWWVSGELSKDDNKLSFYVYIWWIAVMNFWADSTFPHKSLSHSPNLISYKFIILSIFGLLNLNFRVFGSFWLGNTKNLRWKMVGFHFVCVCDFWNKSIIIGIFWWWILCFVNLSVWVTVGQNVNVFSNCMAPNEVFTLYALGNSSPLI